MAINLDIAYVNGKPTYITETKSQCFPTLNVEEYDVEYRVRVIKAHAYPVDNMDFPGISYDEYHRKAYTVIYRHGTQCGNIIDMSDLSYLYCPDERLEIIRVKLSSRHNFYVAVTKDGKFVNNKMNREIFGSEYFNENKEERVDES